MTPRELRLQLPSLELAARDWLDRATARRSSPCTGGWTTRRASTGSRRFSIGCVSWPSTCPGTAFTGEPLRADDVFQDWTIANYLMDGSVEDGRVYYHNYPGAPQAYETETIACPQDQINRSVSQYGADYIALGCNPGQYNLHFEGATATGLLPADAYSGKMSLWSNKDDESDMTLTREFDFTGVNGPIEMTYQTWYDLEENWDYAYVLASADGVTWQILFQAATIIGILALIALLLHVLNGAFGYAALEYKVDPKSLTVAGLPLDQQNKNQLISLLQAKISKGAFNKLEKDQAELLHEPKSDEDALVEGVRAGDFSADELLGRYCAMLYRRHGSYAEVAQRSGLDPRTARKYVLTAARSA